jgi:hypothetical protein
MPPPAASQAQFYPRVTNNTNIVFTDEENALLQEGLKYNLYDKPKQWLHKLAIEVKTAVTLLPPPDQNPARYLIAKNLERPALNCKQKVTSYNNSYAEKSLIDGIKEKLQQNNAIVTNADKGGSIIVVDKADYESKILQFLTCNQFQTIRKGPTRKFQAMIRKAVNQCTAFIPSK